MKDVSCAFRLGAFVVILARVELGFVEQADKRGHDSECQRTNHSAAPDFSAALASFAVSPPLRKICSGLTHLPEPTPRLL